MCNFYSLLFWNGITFTKKLITSTFWQTMSMLFVSLFKGEKNKDNN